MSIFKGNAFFGKQTPKTCSKLDRNSFRSKPNKTLSNQTTMRLYCLYCVFCSCIYLIYIKKPSIRRTCDYILLARICSSSWSIKIFTWSMMEPYGFEFETMHTGNQRIPSRRRRRRLLKSETDLARRIL